MKGGQVSPEATMALNEMRQRTSAQEYGRFILEALKSTGLVGRPFNETPIGQAAALRWQPLEQQLAVSENDPAFGFAGTTVGKGIRAFHGSPHSFDKFDLGKIGTGEGAQAYGRGLYFAEAEEVARSYRDALAGSNTRWMLGDRVLSGPEQNAATLLDWAGGNKDKAFASLRLSRGTRMADQNYLDATEAALREMDPALVKVVQDTGHMYEVNINASPDEFLDWDVPISKQPSARGVVERLISQRGGSPRYWAERLGDNPDGQKIVRELNTGGGVLESALADEGLRGIKYLDQGSRAAGDGSRNYVVFDPNIVEILRKYGMLPPTVLAGTLGYGNSDQQ